MADELQQWVHLLGVKPGASSLEVCERFSRLAVRLAPADLADVPFYAMPTSALPEKFTTASRWCGGWYHHHLYDWLRTHLPADRGPGLAVVVVDQYSTERRLRTAEAVQAVYAARGEVVPMDDILPDVPSCEPIESICRTLVHELAHALISLHSGEWGEWGTAFEGMYDHPAVQARIDSQINALVEVRESQAEQPPAQLDCHGLDFVRAMVHLTYRCEVLGIHTPPDKIPAAGEYYQQRPFADCVQALGREPIEYLNHSFADILALPLSPKFAACQLNTPAMAG